MDLDKFIIVFILGIIGGLTELLPISSTGHVILATYFFKLSNDEYLKNFEIIVQLGSIISILIFFWKRLVNIIIIQFKDKKNKNSYLSLKHIFLGTLPAIILGTIFYESIKSNFKFNFILKSMIAGSIFIFLVELIKPVPTIHKIDHLNYLRAFLIGCFQCLAFFPGFSRSGATIGGALLIGVNRLVATEFSFILSIPISFSAIFLEIYKNLNYFFNFFSFLTLLISFTSSLVTSMVTIKIFLKFVKNTSLIYFSIYRFFVIIIVYLCFT